MATQQFTAPASQPHPAISASTQTATPAQYHGNIPVLEFTDCGDGTGPNYMSPQRCGTDAQGDRIPVQAFVPAGNVPPVAGDELSGFREAQPHPQQGLLFAARVAIQTNDPAYPVGSLVVFDWEREPVDGDIVCAEAIIQDRPDTLLQRALTAISYRSLKAETLLRRWRYKMHQPTHKVYLLRRYVALAEPVKGTPEWVRTGVEKAHCNLRLETLDGIGVALTHGPLVFVQVLGVATALRPWGWHRDVVMV